MAEKIALFGNAFQLGPDLHKLRLERIGTAVLELLSIEFDQELRLSGRSFLLVLHDHPLGTT